MDWWRPEASGTSETASTGDDGRIIFWSLASLDSRLHPPTIHKQLFRQQHPPSLSHSVSYSCCDLKTLSQSWQTIRWREWSIPRFITSIGKFPSHTVKATFRHEKLTLFSYNHHGMPKMTLRSWYYANLLRGIHEEMLVCARRYFHQWLNWLE